MNEKPKFTPGPWYVITTVEQDPGRAPKTRHNVFKKERRYAHIAECETLVDAHLLAAAPEGQSYIAKRIRDLSPAVLTALCHELDAILKLDADAGKEKARKINNLTLDY